MIEILGLKLSLGQLVLIGALGIVILFFGFMSMIRSFIHICRPNEILIFSGRKRRAADGSTVGYRVVFGGLAFRMPIVETVDRMDMTVIPIELQVTNAYSKGGIPLNVAAVANIKISSDERVVMNAIERFLGRSRDELRRVAKETLEGSLRGVLATLTPEQVNEDRLKFAESLSDEVEDDLEKLGLQLDTLKIQHVHDDVNYLDSISRQQIALILKEAENAESDAKREAEQAEAREDARASKAEEEAKQVIAKKANELRRYQADLRKLVQAAEEKALGSAREARAIAEQELQAIRRQVEEQRLEADVTIPARMEQEARNYLAQGQSALIEERGAALAKAFAMLSEAWVEAGGSAKEIFLVQQIDQLARQVADSVSGLKVGQVNLLDKGDGQALASYVRSFPAAVNALLEELKTTTGIDIAQTIGGTSNGLERQKGGI